MAVRVKRVEDVKHGDYVLCTKYPDRGLYDQWQVGFLDRAEMHHGSILFFMQEPQRSYFKCCWKLTGEEGDLICRANNPHAVKVVNARGADGRWV